MAKTTFVTRCNRADDSVTGTFAIRRDSPGDVKSEAAARKMVPLYSGLLKYFPLACAAVAHASFVGNEQHNPGEPLHWARGKSNDHEDCVLRHLNDRAQGRPIDSDGQRHMAKVAWRALAALELELEATKK